MKRLITTGCSFTTYTPTITWPIFLSEKFDETYNYGQHGAGNKFIFNSIIEADSELKLTPDDLVIVQWSGFFRHDMLKREFDGFNIKQYWKTNGDWTYWPKHRKGDETLLYQCITESFSEEEYIHMTHVYMLALVRYLRAKNIPYLFTSLNDLRGSGLLLKNKNGELEELYDDNFIISQGLVSFLTRDKILLNNKLGWSWGGHPSNSLHYKIAETFAKRLDFSLSSHDDLFDLDKLTVNEALITSKNLPFDKHPLNKECLIDISESQWTGIHRQGFKYHPGTLAIHKQILKDVCL
jgi:hypothetical protein